MVVLQPTNMTQIPRCFSILHNDNVFHINTEWSCKQQINFRHLLQSPDLTISEPLRKFKSWECEVPLKISVLSVNMHHETLVSVNARSVCNSEVLCCNTWSSFPSTLTQKENNDRNQRRQPEAWVIKHCVAFLGIFVLHVCVWLCVNIPFLWHCAKEGPRL